MGEMTDLIAEEKGVDDSKYAEDIQDSYNPIISAVPVMTVDQFLQRRNSMLDFVARGLREGIDADYGTIPGTAKKNLLLPGAEKLKVYLGLRTEPKLVESIVDPFGGKFGGQIPFYYFRYETKIIVGNNVVEIGHGSANSQENKWGFKWVDIDQFPGGIPEFNGQKCPTRTSGKRALLFQIKEAQTEGQYGKPKEYWKEFQDALDSNNYRKYEQLSKGNPPKKMEGIEIGTIQVRVPNDDVSSQANTILKIAKKRSEMDGVKNAAAVSDIFTVDLEDMDLTNQWNPFSTGSMVTVPEIKTEKKEEEIKQTTAVTTPAAIDQTQAANATSKASTLPVLQPPRAKVPEPQTTTRQAPSATTGDAKPIAGKRKAAEPVEDLFPEEKQVQKTEIKEQKTLEPDSKPEPVILTKIINQKDINDLKAAFNEAKIDRTIVIDYIKKKYNKLANEMNYLQLNEVIKWIKNGSRSETSMDVAKKVIAASKIPYNEVNEYCITTYGKPITHLESSEIIKLDGWIEDNSRT